MIGSSAMPFTRNSINAEKINSLARALSLMPQLSWQNAANSLLERTLDDSANRRTLIPEAFLISDEIIQTAISIIQGLEINLTALERNCSLYSPFVNSERLLMKLVRAGANRQEMHTRLRGHAATSWQAIYSGKPDNLIDRVTNDSMFLSFLSSDEIKKSWGLKDILGLHPRQHALLPRNLKTRSTLQTI